MADGRAAHGGLVALAPRRTCRRGAHASDVDAALSLVAKTTTIVATWDRMRRGLEPIAPHPNLATAANFLYMSTGKEPSAEHAKALDQYYVLLADHGYNASTFSARVTASTNADLYCAITAALATLTATARRRAESSQDALHRRRQRPTKPNRGFANCSSARAA